LAINALWDKTDDVFVLIESGTPEGFRLVSNVRQMILDSEEGKAHVVAPCSHDIKCPLTEGNKNWCNFRQRTVRTKFQVNVKKEAENYEDASFSYICIRRGPRPNNGDLNLHPVMRKPLKEKKKVTVPICKEGKIIKEVVTNTSNLYKNARKISQHL